MTLVEQTVILKAALRIFVRDVARDLQRSLRSVSNYLLVVLNQIHMRIHQ